MLGKLEPTILMLAIASVGMLSFFIGNAVHHLVKDDAYGVVGNTAIIFTGFLVTIEYGDRVGLIFRNLDDLFFVGLAGSCVALIVLSMFKMASNRLL